MLSPPPPAPPTPVICACASFNLCQFYSASLPVLVLPVPFLHVPFLPVPFLPVQSLRLFWGGMGHNGPWLPKVWVIFQNDGSFFYKKINDLPNNPVLLEEVPLAFGAPLLDCLEKGHFRKGGTSDANAHQLVTVFWSETISLLRLHIILYAEGSFTIGCVSW